MGFFDFIVRMRSSKNVSAVLYARLIELARAPALYGEGGAPDSFDGRFDILVAHIHFVLRRLRGAEHEAFAQDLFDRFFVDMDITLREMGVSDVGVGKKVRKMASAFYGRAGAYDVVFEAPVTSRVVLMSQALGRNLYPDDVAAARRLLRLAAYFIALEDYLVSHALDDILRGEILLESV